MTFEEAINVSQISAARGFNEKNECVVAVAFYGNQLMWLPGFGGEWAKKWSVMEPEDKEKLKDLVFKPTGPKPPEQIEREVIAAITEITDDEDEFEPIGDNTPDD